MKESKEWIRQPMVDKAADEIVTARGCTPAEVTPYQVSQHLVCEPNGALYAKVRDWRRRRQDEMGLAAIEMPLGAETEFRALLERMMTEATDHFVRTVRMVGSDMDRAAALRVADAERRRDEAEAGTAEVLELCERAEAGLALAQVTIVALEQALAEAQRREDNLRGRLEQREADAARASVAVTANGIDVAKQSVASAPADPVNGEAPVQHVMGFTGSGEKSE